MGIRKIAVLGAGNGGQAAAADLTLRGYEVALFELPQFEQNIRPIIDRGGIEIQVEKKTSCSYLLFCPFLKSVSEKGYRS